MSAASASERVLGFGETANVQVPRNEAVLGAGPKEQRDSASKTEKRRGP